MKPRLRCDLGTDCLCSDEMQRRCEYGGPSAARAAAGARIHWLVVLTIALAILAGLPRLVEFW